MSLHPNQIILGAVQIGKCSDINDINPYNISNKKKYMGWEQGHETVIKEYKEQQKYNNLSFFRKFLCKIGFHKYSLKCIPGRPHINSINNNIDRRDPIIKKYKCIYCPATHFIDLDG